MSDPTAPRYSVVNNRLYRDTEELVAGPLTQLEQFCKVLNAADPDDLNVALTVRALISMTRDCSFAVGPRMLQDGTPMRYITPQKLKKHVKELEPEPEEMGTES